MPNPAKKYVEEDKLPALDADANRPLDGLKTDRKANCMGLRASHAAIPPRQRRVPKQNLIGAGGGGRDIATATFGATAALVGVMSTGVMRAAFDCALRYAKT